MPNQSLRIQFEEVIKRIFAFVENPVTRRRLLILAAVQLKDRISAYPVAGRWNSAPGTKGDNRWYQRGFGTRYLRKDGTIGGRNTSQQLQKSWKVETQDDRLAAHVFTEVTYAPFLLDENKRVSWANGHGWQTVWEVEKEYINDFEDIILNAVDDELNKP